MGSNPLTVNKTLLKNLRNRRCHYQKGNIMEQNGTILQRLDSTSSQCQFLNDHKKRPSLLMGSWFSGWTKFESLVGIFLIFLNLTVIGILFPMVTSNVSKLNKLVEKENDIGKTLKESFIKQTNLIEKIDGVNDKQIQHQIQLDEIDGIQMKTKEKINDVVCSIGSSEMT